MLACLYYYIPVYISVTQAGIQLVCVGIEEEGCVAVQQVVSPRLRRL